MRRSSKNVHAATSMKAVVLGLLIVSAVASTVAQTPPPRAEAPELKVGDRWKSEVRDRRTKNKESERDRSITAVSATLIEGLENGAKLTMTPDQTVIESPTVVSTGDGGKFLNFPLEVGKKWEHKYNYKSKVSGAAIKWQMEANVVAIEKVKVPAGEFDAYKIQTKGFWNNGLSGNSGRLQMTDWYAPSARTIVKTEYDDGYNSTVRELIELQLQP